LREELSLRDGICGWDEATGEGPLVWRGSF
jgi:hypothetical protein